MQKKTSFRLMIVSALKAFSSDHGLIAILHCLIIIE